MNISFSHSPAKKDIEYSFSIEMSRKKKKFTNEMRKKHSHRAKDKEKNGKQGQKGSKKLLWQ